MKENRELPSTFSEEPASKQIRKSRAGNEFPGKRYYNFVGSRT